MTVLMEILNSAPFTVFVTGLIVSIIKYFHDKKLTDEDSTYAKRMAYVALIKPYVVDGVKFVEKSIPNNHPNKAIAKADLALRSISKMLETTGHDVIPEMIAKAVVDIVEDMNYKNKLDGLAPSGELTKPTLVK